MSEQDPITFPIRDPLLGKLKERNEVRDNDQIREVLAHPAEWIRLQQHSYNATWLYIRARLDTFPNPKELTDQANNEAWLTLMRKVDPSYQYPFLAWTYIQWQADGAISKTTRELNRPDAARGDFDFEAVLGDRLFTEASENNAPAELSLDKMLSVLGDGLDDQSIKIVKARILDGATFEDLGARFDMNSQALRRRYFAALAHMRERLNELNERGDEFPSL